MTCRFVTVVTFFQIIRLTRPFDSWLEHVNFATLFSCLTDEEVLLVFAAAVLERRIIFIADELGYYRLTCTLTQTATPWETNQADSCQPEGAKPNTSLNIEDVTLVHSKILKQMIRLEVECVLPLLMKLN